MAGHSCGKYANSWRKYAGISRFNPFPCLNMAKGKIIVMRLFGGLGNQLFQYAFLFALSRQGEKQDWKPHHMNMMIRGSANSITSGFPFPLKEALPPGLSASPVFPPACVPCSPLPNILISGRKNGTGSIPVSRLLPAAIPISRDIFRRNNTSSTAGNSFAGNSV